jgi:hypothetical protein
MYAVCIDTRFIEVEPFGIGPEEFPGRLAGIYG